MKKTIFIAIISLATALTGCKKDKEEALEYDTQTAYDNALVEGVFNDVNNIANQAISGNLSTYRTGPADNDGSLLSACATVTITPDSTNIGGYIVVNFGSVPCRCRDNRFRKGIINVRYTGPYRDSATVITTTFNNYYVGNDSLALYKVEGTKTVVNRGRNSAGNKYFTVNISNARLISPATEMTWNSTRQREWIGGEGTTGNWTDDTYSITGSASGRSFNGTNFSVNITSPLIFSLDCAYIRQGRFDLTPENKPTRTFDYGGGACDALATVTVNGRTFNIILR